VACSDSVIPSNGSVLWDNLRNEAVDAHSVIMNGDVDEMLPRTECKWAGDEHGKRFAPHAIHIFNRDKGKCRDIAN
jgi:hypothetical protein